MFMLKIGPNIYMLILISSWRLFALSILYNTETHNAVLMKMVQLVICHFAWIYPPCLCINECQWREMIEGWSGWMDFGSAISAGGPNLFFLGSGVSWIWLNKWKRTVKYISVCKQVVHWAGIYCIHMFCVYMCTHICTKHGLHVYDL